MEFIIEGEDYQDHQFDKNKIKKKIRITDPDISTESNNNTSLTKPIFISKEERIKLITSEEKLKEKTNKIKEEEIKRHKRYYENISKEKNYNRDKDKNKISRSGEKDDKYESKNDKMQEKEIEAIKNHYLGFNKEKRKMIKPSEKFKNIFNFEWDYSEDTSADTIPIYQGKTTNDLQILFGRGIRGGYDYKEQRLKSKNYEKLIKEQRDNYMSIEEKEKSSKLLKLKRSRQNSQNKSSPGKSKQENLFNDLSEKPIEEMTDRDWRIFREDNDIIIKGGRVPAPIREWTEGDLPEFILQSIRDAGYQKPSSIQMQTIPIGLEKRDLIGLAPTGSGKSAAFLIPLIVYLKSLPSLNLSSSSSDGPYAIIIVPSRELAIQIYDEFNKFAGLTKLKAACIVGGRSTEEQALQLGMGVELIIGTPGRIQDCLDQHLTTLNQCHYVILDEADKLIKDDFEESVNKILDSIPSNNLKSENEQLAEAQEKETKLLTKRFRVTMMFSATMSPQLEKLARKYLRCPSYISIGEPGYGKKAIEQIVEFVSESQKTSRLRNVIDRHRPPIIIFVNHKKSVDHLYKTLDKLNYKVVALHGGKTQDAREKAMKNFKNGKYDILITTNVSARGIDVEAVSLVVNYDCPENIEDYNHRIGRTGRAEMNGKAITFLTNSDDEIFYDLVEYLQHNNQKVPEELLQHSSSKIKKTKNGKYENTSRRKQVVYTA